MEEDKIVHGLKDQNLGAHVRLEKVLQELQYGTVVVTFTLQAGRITDMVTQEHKRYRFTPKKNLTNKGKY